MRDDAEAERCPMCSAPTIIDGRVRHGVNDLGGTQYSAFRFVPTGMRRFLIWPPRPILLARTFRCCLTCGHLWSSVNPGQLREYIRKHGDQYAQWDLEPFEKLPADDELA